MIIETCVICGQEVACRANEVPYCHKCSGKEQIENAEKQRWNALTLEQKVEELKQIVDSLKDLDSRLDF